MISIEGRSVGATRSKGMSTKLKQNQKKKRFSESGCEVPISFVEKVIQSYELRLAHSPCVICISGTELLLPAESVGQLAAWVDLIDADFLTLASGS